LETSLVVKAEGPFTEAIKGQRKGGFIARLRISTSKTVELKMRQWIWENTDLMQKR